MYPRILHIHGPIWIQSYGTMIVIGLFVFMMFTWHQFKQRALMTAPQYTSLLTWSIIGGFLGGRAYEVLTDWHSFADNWLDIIKPWVGGLGILGAILGILIAATLFLRSHRIPALPVFDSAASYAPLMQAIARIGCLLAGCCYGLPAPHLPWAITYTNPYCLAPLGQPLHPTQLYLVGASLLVFACVQAAARLKARQPGDLLFIYLIAESCARATVELWRGDRSSALVSSLLHDTVLTSAHVVAGVVASIGIAGLLWNRLSCRAN